MLMKKRSKKTKYVFRTALIAVLLAFLGAATTGICHVIVQQDGELLYYEYAPTIDKVDYVVVPGMWMSKTYILPQLRTRLLRAVELYNENRCDKIILSGSEDEVWHMSDYIQNQGVPEEAIIVDAYGIDTYNTLRRVKEAFPDSSILFCTQERYFKRADYIMRSLAMEGQCINADLIIYNTSFSEQLKEYLAATKAVWEAGVFQPAPTYSLEECPMVQQ